MAHNNNFRDPVRMWDTCFGGPDFLVGTEPNAYLPSQRALLAVGKWALAVADGEGMNGV